MAEISYEMVWLSAMVSAVVGVAMVGDARVVVGMVLAEVRMFDLVAMVSAGVGMFDLVAVV